jgi:hypothetical protein
LVVLADGVEFRDLTLLDLRADVRGPCQANYQGTLVTTPYAVTGSPNSSSELTHAEAVGTPPVMQPGAAVFQRYEKGALLNVGCSYQLGTGSIPLLGPMPGVIKPTMMRVTLRYTTSGAGAYAAVARTDTLNLRF